jgi:hypothetical protein
VARLAFLLLLVAAGALLVALLFDHRGRRDVRFDRLRQAFLHGMPLQGGRPGSVSLPEVAHPDGLRFRAPASWTIDMLQVDRVRPDVPAEGRRVQVEVLQLEGAGPVADVLKGIPIDGERSVEVLPNGHVLMKSLEAVRGPGVPVASYTWRLARAAPRGGLQLGVFRLRLPLEAAAEVIGQVDLGTLEREIREAVLFDGAVEGVG